MSNGEDLFVQVTPGARDILGLEPSIDAVVERLKLYEPDLVFRVVSTISGFLEVGREPRRSNAEAQLRATELVFGPIASQVIAKVRAWVALRKQPPAILFHELQLLNLMKVVFLLGADWRPPTPRDDRIALAEAMLMMNDLIAHVPPGDPATDEGWHELLTANALFNHGDNPLHRQARTHEVFFGASSGGLGVRAARLLGMTPTEYWAAHMIVGSYWRSPFPASAAVLKEPFISVTHFVHELDLAPAQIDALFALVATQRAAIVEQCRALYSLQNLRPFHLDVLARSPIVLDGDRAVCISNQLLEYRATRGLFDALKERETPECQQHLSSDLGEAFDRYVDALLHRAFTKKGPYTLIDGAQMKRVFRSEKACDAVILRGDAVLLIESKSLMFAKGVRAGEDPKKLHRQSRSVFVESAEQLDATIKAVRAGRLAEFGVKPEAVKQYLPVTLMLEENPVTPLTGTRIGKRISEAGFLQEADVAPLTVLDAASLEFVEIGVKRGGDVNGIIAAKAASDPFDSFGNYCLRVHATMFTEGQNPHLVATFQKLYADVIAWSKSHAKPGSSWTRKHLPFPAWRPPTSRSAKRPDGERKRARTRQKAARRAGRTR